MNRREAIKSLIIGTVGVTVPLTVQASISQGDGDDECGEWEPEHLYYEVRDVVYHNGCYYLAKIDPISQRKSRL